MTAPTKLNSTTCYHFYFLNFIETREIKKIDKDLSLTKTRRVKMLGTEQLRKTLCRLSSFFKHRVLPLFNL